MFENTEKHLIKVGGQNYMVYFWRQAHCVYGVSCSGYTYFLVLETSALRLWCFLLWIHVLSCFGDKRIAFMVFLAMDTRTFLLWRQAHCVYSVPCSGYTYFLALETSALCLWCFLFRIHVFSCFEGKHIAFMVFLALDTRTFLLLR